MPSHAITCIVALGSSTSFVASCNLGATLASTGCSSAPACPTDCQSERTNTCEEYYTTFCQGCFKGVPSCASGWSTNSDYGNNKWLANGVTGGGCDIKCCRRGCKKTHSRYCPKVGCCTNHNCPIGYDRKSEAQSIQGDASDVACCQIQTGKCNSYTCPAGYKKKSDASSVEGAASAGACCDICSVSDVKGVWIYKYDGNSGDSYTLSEGISSSTEASFERTNEWSASLSRAVSAGIQICSDSSIGSRRMQSASFGLSACGSLGIEVTKETGQSMAITHGSSFTKEKSSETQQTVSINHDGSALWQWEYSVMDTCGRGARASTSQFAFTPARHNPPRCLPGYCDSNDHPLAMCCQCKDAPSGQSVEITGAPQCPSPVCSTDMKARVVLGSAIDITAGQDITASSEVSIQCSSVNPDYIGTIKLRCSEAVNLVPDASGCSKLSSGPIPAPSPAASPMSSPIPPAQVNQCVCGAGVAATGALCPSMGSTFCVSCHQGYVRRNDDCVQDSSNQAPNPSPSPSPSESANQCVCSAGVAASGALCPSMGATFCAYCHKGYVRRNNDCVQDTIPQTPDPSPSPFPSPAALVESIAGSLLVAVSDSEAILGNSAAKAAFETAMATEIAAVAGNGVTQADVTAFVSAAGSGRRLDGSGSDLSVTYRITMRNDLPALSVVVSTIRGRSASQLHMRVQAALDSVPALASLHVRGVSHQSGPAAVSSESAPSPSPFSLPTPASDSSPSPSPSSPVNQCVCSAGTPAAGPSCKEMGALSCESCHAGYKLARISAGGGGFECVMQEGSPVSFAANGIASNAIRQYIFSIFVWQLVWMF